MVTFLFTLGVFAIVIVMMALGVLVAGRRLRGSCGGVGGEACSCGPEKQARCKDGAGGVVPHADVPIDPSALTRRAQRPDVG